MASLLHLSSCLLVLFLQVFFLGVQQSIKAQGIISENPIEEISNPNQGQQQQNNQSQQINLLRLQKKWTLHPNGNITKFTFNFPGRVFIRYQNKEELNVTNNSMGEIRISGDSHSLVDLFRVSTTNVQNELKIHLKKTSRDKRVKGHLLVEIIMYAKNRIESIQTANTDIFVVQASDALVSEYFVPTSASGLQLISIGPGDIFLHSLNPIYLPSLDVQISGSGDIQLDLPKLNISTEVSVRVTGSGDFLLKADELIASTTLKSVVRGSGDICMTSSFMNISNMNTMVVGSGTTSYSIDGYCKQQVIAVLGSGDVYAGSIKCSNGTVEVLGSGNVLVQVAHTLKAASPTLGTVSYIGKRPKQILSSELITKNTFPVNEASENTIEKCTVTTFPEPHATFVSIDFSMDETAILWDFIRKNRAYVIGMSVVLAIGVIWHFVYEESFSNDPKERQPLLTTNTPAVYV